MNISPCMSLMHVSTTSMLVLFKFQQPNEQKLKQAALWQVDFPWVIYWVHLNTWQKTYTIHPQKKKIYKLVDKYTWSLKWTYSNPTPPAPAACYSTSTYRCMVYLVLSSYRERSHCHCLSCFVQCLLCLLSIVSYPSVMRFTLLHIPEKVYRCM